MSPPLDRAAAADTRGDVLWTNARWSENPKLISEQPTTTVTFSLALRASAAWAAAGTVT